MTQIENPVLQSIHQNRIVIIYRGYSPEECLEASEVLYDAGIRLFEVAMNSKDTKKAINLLQTKLKSDVFVGAGTVMKPDQVKLAHDAGASYIISPNTDAEVIKQTKKLDMISIPGAMTPTEAAFAVKRGGDIIKIFPINVFGPELIHQFKGPLDNIDFLACGGINIEMIEGLFQAGSSAIGIGAQLLGEGLIKNKKWDLLHDQAQTVIRASKASD